MITAQGYPLWVVHHHPGGIELEPVVAWQHYPDTADSAEPITAQCGLLDSSARGGYASTEAEMRQMKTEFDRLRHEAWLEQRREAEEARRRERESWADLPDLEDDEEQVDLPDLEDACIHKSRHRPAVGKRCPSCGKADTELGPPKGSLAEELERW